MESFFSRYRNVLVLIVVLVAQLLALAVQAKRPKADGADGHTVSLIRYMVVSVVTPPERLVHGTGQWFRSVWYGYVDLIHVRRENAKLQQQIQRLRLEQASIAQDAAQGLRLQNLLGFREHYINTTLPAQVIGTGGTDQSQVLLIDKGSKDGLKQDMPVITADGIVGKVKDVFPHTSQVLLASDPTSGVGVILQNTRIRGILRGRAYGQLEVTDISPDARVQAGEPIVTSGGDQIFPRGLPVGTVERVIPDPEHDPLVNVLVRPAAKLSQLEEVLVITKLSDQMSSQEAKDLAESEVEQKRASDVLAERLPSRLDANAPPDTNPEQLVNSAGVPVKPAPAPQPIHPDRFSPGAEPDATEMVPGHRWAPVKDGTEDRPKAVGSALTAGGGAPGRPATPKPAGSSTAAVAAARPATVRPRAEQPKVTDGEAAVGLPKKAPAKAVALPANRPSAETAPKGPAQVTALPGGTQ